MSEYSSLKELLAKSDDLELIRRHAQMLHEAYLSFEDYLKNKYGESWYEDESIEYARWLIHKSFETS